MTYTTERLPRVLLVGNGVVRGKSGKSWDKLLDSISERPDEEAENLLMSMPLKAVYLTNDTIREKLKKNNAAFFGELRDENVRERLRALMDLDFDEILTTNYSYELEMAASGRETVTASYLKKISKSILPDKRAEAKYMLSTCNHVPYGGAERRIWHIHGEARKPDSMILGHYYYALLMKRNMTYLESRAGDFRAFGKGELFEVRSWLDSFILGDVTVLGFGMDFSEFDLWWLLNRKKREAQRHGVVRFFTPRSGEQSDHERNELLRLLDVEVTEISMEKDAWDEYYREAIRQISELLS